MHNSKISCEWKKYLVTFETNHDKDYETLPRHCCNLTKMEKIRRDVQNGEIDNKMKIQGLENQKQDSFHWKVRLGSSPILSIARNAGEDYSLMASNDTN